MDLIHLSLLERIATALEKIAGITQVEEKENEELSSMIVLLSKTFEIEEEDIVFWHCAYFSADTKRPPITMTGSAHKPVTTTELLALYSLLPSALSHSQDTPNLTIYTNTPALKVLLCEETKDYKPDELCKTITGYLNQFSNWNIKTEIPDDTQYFMERRINEEHKRYMEDIK